MESFERSLEQAQRDLGIDPINQIPVSYVTEGEWLKGLVWISPTLILIAATFFLTRKVSSEMGGKGVSE